MVEVRYNRAQKHCEVFFNGSKRFHDMVSLMKNNHLQFDPTSKAWVCKSSLKMLNLLSSIDDIEDYVLNEADLKMMEATRYGKLEVKRVRRDFSEEDLNSPALGQYQIDGVKKFIYDNRCINADGTGLGKTYQTISALSILFKRGIIEKIIIVALNSILYNWKREFLLFSDVFKEEDFFIVDRNNRNPFIDGYDKKVIICSYSGYKLMTKDFYVNNGGKKTVKNYRKPVIPFDKWVSKEKGCIVLDEMHSIKSIKSQQRKYIDLHKNYFDFRFGLTATPFSNKVEEIFALMNFLDPAVLGDSFYDFLEDIANVGNRFSRYAVNYYYEDKVKALKQKLKPYILQRIGSEVLKDLPELTVKKIYLPLKEKQKDIYRSVIDDELVRIREESGVLDSKEVFNKFPYLVLACSDVSILKGKFEEGSSLAKKIDKWKLKDNSKLEYLDFILSEHKDEKILVWSSHPKTIDVLAEYYKKYEPLVIHGQTKFEDKDTNRAKDNLVNEFRNNPDKKLAIISSLVLGTGVSIPESSISVFFDRDWSVVNWIQSLGRNHRAISLKDVIAYVLIADNTLENLQDRSLDKKETLNRKFIKENTLSKESWRDIFDGK